MEILSNLALGFGVALSPFNLLMCLVGVLHGTLIGVLPGVPPAPSPLPTPKSRNCSMPSASATPWSNAGEIVSWPRIGEINVPPPDPQRRARAIAAMPGVCTEVPGAVSHAVFLRGTARVRAGGLDIASFRSWYAALADLSLRMAGLGWRNVHCDRAFVVRRGEGLPGDGDMDALSARWPGWHARVANFLMDDPLRVARERLQFLLSQGAGLPALPLGGGEADGGGGPAALPRAVLTPSVTRGRRRTG